MQDQIVQGVEAVQLGGNAPDFSILGMFMQADFIEDTFWSGQSLDELYTALKGAPNHPLAAVFVAAMREWQRSLGTSASGLDKVTVQDRVYKAMHVTTSREMDRLEGQVGYLATIGSAAPFVGLFGTVWGIMNSFTSIATASDTSLATVAPGIAEALLATAFGLVAAIPAVIGYNKLSTDLGVMRAGWKVFRTNLPPFCHVSLMRGLTNGCDRYIRWPP